VSTPTIDRIRNGYHYQIGLSFMYFFGFINESRYFANPVTMTIVSSIGFGLIIGYVWEYFMQWLFQTETYLPKISHLDAMLVVFGCLSGGFLSLYYPKLWVLISTMSVSAIILLIEVIRVYRLKKR